MKTTEEIKNEIEKLATMKPNVRHYSAFGDDHHAAIQAQIEVLENRMDNDDVYDTFGDEDSDDFRQNVLDQADYAARWMRDEEDAAPSEDWQGLVNG